LAGVIGQKTYLKPRLKIASAAPFASTIGILYFSVIALAESVGLVPYGPRTKFTLSSVISFSVSFALVSGLDSSS